MSRINNPALTDKEQAFIDHYIICKNGTKSARLAGFEGDDNALGVRAYELLRNSKIKKQIARRLAETTMQADEVLHRYTDIARGDLGEFSEVKTIQDLKNHPKSHLVKKIEISRRQTINGDVAHITKLELHNPKDGLDPLAKFHNLVADTTVKLSADDDLKAWLKSQLGKGDQ